MPVSVYDFIPWIVAGLIVLFGLLVYGFRDVIRFSPKRVWAISSVNFAESLRRRVLWITPLAILGVIVVSQLQHPVDEQDAIRQTTKFCLFTSGLLVTVTAIILACTNLPREIESRVIYTVVTKPTTRLEIIVGKIVGFARVSATILIIMGVFTYGYLKVREHYLRQYIGVRLSSEPADSLNRPALEHYQQAGLLASRVYETPDDLQIYSREPDPSDERRFMFGAAEGQFLVPFRFPDEWRRENPPALQIELTMGAIQSKFMTEDPTANIQPTTLPWMIQNPDATLEQVTTSKPPERNDLPLVSIQILDGNFNALVGPDFINNRKPIRISDPEGNQTITAPIDPNGVQMMVSRGGVFYVQVDAVGVNYEYFARQMPVAIRSSDNNVLEPIKDPRDRSGQTVLLPRFQTRTGTYGMQLRGGTGKVPLAVFKFRDTPTLPGDGNGHVPFEMRVGIERDTGDATTEDLPTELDVMVLNRTVGAKPSAPVKVYPETNRTAYFSLPASAITGKDFDVLISCRSPQQYVGVTPRSLLLITDSQPFAWNLMKSMLVMWLMSVLVVIVSIFASTFLSWPIAIVLTILILLGRWGVMQLGDATAPGIGNAVATDLFKSTNAAVATTVSTSVEVLAKFLNAVTSVLPDISQFTALEDLEAGVAIPMFRLIRSLQVLALFGIPMTVLAYVLLRQKEVAP